MIDEALQAATETFSQAEELGLIYSRAEARRTLAHVHYRRGDLDDAERLCSEARSLVSDTESRVSRLWFGPLYIEVLIALSLREKAAGRATEADAKLAEAREHLTRYSELVSLSQTPRFSGEAARLEQAIQSLT